MPIQILYLDCDGFFAACEESADSALHGRPVAVSTIDPDNRAAVLIAVNTAAKRRGLSKGERAEEARRLVPDLTVRHQRPELYVATHHAIARALDTVVPGARSHSVDELAAELAPSDEPEAILEQVKAAIAETLGPVITVSCGVAPNAFLAKTAAEANKPNAAIVWRACATSPRCTRRSSSPICRGSGRPPKRGCAHATSTPSPRSTTQGATARNGRGGRSSGATCTRRCTGTTNRRLRGRAGGSRTGARSSRGCARGRRHGSIVRFLVACTVHRCRLEGVAAKKLGLEVLTEHRRALGATTPIAPTNDEAAMLRSGERGVEPLRSDHAERAPPIHRDRARARALAVTPARAVPPPARAGAGAHRQSARHASEPAPSRSATASTGPGGTRG